MAERPEERDQIDWLNSKSGVLLSCQHTCLHADTRLEKWKSGTTTTCFAKAKLISLPDNFIFILSSC